MASLDKDLQQKKISLIEFSELADRILRYIPNVLSSFETKGNYRIYTSTIAGTTKFIRPLNEKMFIFNHQDFENKFKEFQKIILKIKQKKLIFSEREKEVIDQVLYTIQQSIGAGLDLLVNQNSARKHVGNRFEELVKAVFTEIGISNKRTVLQIPYDTDEGEKIYKCENDLILSPYLTVKSTSKSLDEKEIVVSVKTTSKDRMGKMFIDKLLLEKFVGHKQSVIGVFLNDVQRKENNNISYTLVSGLFMVYTKFLAELQGIYYLDPPPNASKKPYNKHMKKFSQLITEDISKMLTP
jgi:hypothetical protein